MTIAEGTPFPKLMEAPITEAVIDIKTKLSSRTTLEDLASFQEPVKERFTERKTRRSFETRIEFKDNESPAVNAPRASPDGFLFTAPSEHLVAQARFDGFTLSKLQPYSDWGDFSGQARKLWNLFVQVATPEAVSRIAVRYINRIEIPPGADFKEYVLTVPEIARGIPQILENYFMRLMIPGPTGEMAIVTQTFAERTPNSDSLPMIFDIDVFREVDISPHSEELWAVLEGLRAYKNTVFFRSLTFAALRRYGPAH